PLPALEKGGYVRSEPMGYTSTISRLRSVKHQPEPDRGHRTRPTEHGPPTTAHRTRPTGHGPLTRNIGPLTLGPRLHTGTETPQGFGDSARESMSLIRSEKTLAASDVDGTS